MSNTIAPAQITPEGLLANTKAELEEHRKELAARHADLEAQMKELDESITLLAATINPSDVMNGDAYEELRTHVFYIGCREAINTLGNASGESISFVLPFRVPAGEKTRTALHQIFFDVFDDYATYEFEDISEVATRVTITNV